MCTPFCREVMHTDAWRPTSRFQEREREFTVVVTDADFAVEVERMLEADSSKSRLMAPGEHDAKSWWFRFAVNLARLTAPVQ